MSTTSKFLDIITRLMDERETAYDKLVNFHKQDADSLRRVVEEQERYLHQYRSVIGKYQKAEKNIGDRF